MPFSSESGKSYTSYLLEKIARWDTSSKPEGFKVLDVGVGSGTYSNRYRSLLPGIWTGVEIWEPYVREYCLDKKYDKLIIDDIRKMDFSESHGHFHVVFLGDILEHMTKEEAVTLVNHLLSVSYFVLISIPIGHYPQDEYKGNPYEAHITDNWSDEEVKNTFPHIRMSSIDKEIGVYLLSKHDKEIQTIFNPRIAVYGIFKNEEKFMRRFLESCIDADQIVLCDTGSLDGTADIIMDFGLSHDMNNIRLEKITVLPWRFDDARNTALTFVDPDIDLCISLDSDEYLMDGWKQELLSNYDPSSTRYYHRFSTIWESGAKTEHWHDRIHVRHGYKWWLPVHEILENYEREEKVTWLHNFWMYQKPDETKSRGTYFQLLEVSVKERPNVWKSWSFLATEYAQLGKLDYALEALDKALTIDDSDKGFLYNYRANVLNDLNRFDDAIESKRKAISISPNIREYVVYLAEMYEWKYIDTKNLLYLDMAKMTIKQAELITTKTNGYVYNQNCWDEGFETIKNRIMGINNG